MCKRFCLLRANTSIDSDVQKQHFSFGAFLVGPVLLNSQCLICVHTIKFMDVCVHILFVRMCNFFLSYFSLVDMVQNISGKSIHFFQLHNEQH